MKIKEAKLTTKLTNIGYRKLEWISLAECIFADDVTIVADNLNFGCSDGNLKWTRNVSNTCRVKSHSYKHLKT